MEKDLLRIFMLFFSLQYASTQLLPLLYLPFELLQLANQIELLLKTGLVMPVQSNVQKFQCVYTKLYKDYIFQSISLQLHTLRNESEKDEIVYNHKRTFVKTMEDVDARRFFDKISEVRRSFKNLIDKLISNDNSLDRIDLCNYASNQINTEQLKNNIDDLRNEILSQYGSGSDFLSAIGAQYRNNWGSFCGVGTTSTEYIYSLYSNLLSAEMEGHITTSFLYWYLYRYNGTDGCTYNFKRTPDEKIKEIHDNLKQKVIEYTEKFIPVISNVSSTHISCNPNGLERDSTFVELEGSIQALVLPAPYREPYCSRIDTIGLNRDHYCLGYPENYLCVDFPRSCLGRIYSCILYSTQYDFCIDNLPSSRRYKWISGEGLGPLGTCSRKDVYQICVVSGVRIIVDHRVLHLQIQQGKLKKNWQVEDVTWKRINDISEEIYSHRTKKPMRGGIPNLVENVDYRIFSTDEAFNVDEIKVPRNHVLTGVKFHYGTDQHLQIAILTREFDPGTGKITISGEPNIVYGPKGSRLGTSMASHSLAGFRTMQEYWQFPGKLYVIFSASDWLTDSGQTTLPLFDTRPLTSSPPVALGGFGLVYKSAQNMGVAFLTPKLHSLDYSTYLEESLNRLKK